MKTLLVSLALLFAAVSQAQGAPAPSGDAGPPGDNGPSGDRVREQLLCWDLGEFIEPVVRPLVPARCTCDGIQYISFGGVTLGGSAPGSNGGMVPDCYLHTIFMPGYYEAKPKGPVNLVATLEPIIVEVRGCETDDCYWFFGSASCEIESTHQAGSRVSYRVVGACSSVNN